MSNGVSFCPLDFRGRVRWFWLFEFSSGLVVSFWERGSWSAFGGKCALSSEHFLWAIVR